MVDISCVTKWTHLDMRWHGVSVDTLLEAVELERSAAFVIAYCDGGYTTNLPMADVVNDQAFVAYGYDGAPLTPEHGGPARLVVPHLYFWKSAKWIRGLRIVERDQPGFWESFGYHNRGDPGSKSAIGRLSGAATCRWQLAWQIATVTAIHDETPRVKTITLSVPGWTGTPRRSARRYPADGGGRLPGRAQLLDRVRPDRSGADRPDRRACHGRRGLAVPARQLVLGDRFEVRGPIGGYFVWDGARPIRCCSLPVARGSCR